MSPLRLVWAALALGGLAACVTAPPPAKAPSRPSPNGPSQAAPQAPSLKLEPVQFAQLPGWDRAELAPALRAFQRQCEAWAKLAPETPINRNGAPYGGSIGEWAGACAAAAATGPENARGFFQANFVPQRVISQNGQAKLTAYFEPAIQARRSPEPGFSEPLLYRPTDMVQVDIAAFAQIAGNEALSDGPRRLTGQIRDGRIVPYPDRAAIARTAYSSIAWANPADVYNLQVQGSGRLVFPDGSQVRAAFAAQNGYKWRSALGAARDQGRLAAYGGGGWAAFRGYLDANPGEIRPVLDADPSYIFFSEEPITDPEAGPRGAAGVPLTAGGSLAVDPAFHPYGAPIFALVEGVAFFPRLLIAQDTGGAIRRGPLRGDVFMGSGSEAGAAAEKLNADNPRMFVLLPKPQLLAQIPPLLR